MKYLKLFENLESNLWIEISQHEYEDREVINFSNSKRDDILSLFHKDEITIEVNNSVALMIRYHRPKTRREQLNDMIITFEMCDDYWYTVCIEDDYQIHYKCDDITGVKELLKDKDII